MAEDPAVERGDRDVDARRAEVGDQHVPGVRAERELARRPSAGARPGVALDDQAAIEELGDPLRDDAAREARVRDEVAAGLRVPETDLVEDRHERVQRLLGDRSGDGVAGGARAVAHGRIIRGSSGTVTGTFALDTPKYDDDLTKFPRSVSAHDRNRNAPVREACGSVLGPAGRHPTPSPLLHLRRKPSRLLAKPQPRTTTAISEGLPRHMDRRSDIGTAVIGSGFIGTVHIEALRRIGVNVVGLLGSSRERAEQRAEQVDVAHAYASLDELLADDRVDVVHVTSPNELHYPQVRAILAAGRHVVCEKPLAMTSEESADLVRLANASGRVNAVNFNIRFYPLNQHVASMVRDGGVGTVRLVTGRYFQDWLLYDTDWNWRLEPERGGAMRAVGDIGSHWLDLLTFLSGRRVTAVMADLTTFIPVRHKPTGPVETFSTERAVETVPVDIRTEDVATILLRFEGGARGQVAVSQLSPGRKNSLQYEIDGSSSAVAWDSEQPEQLWIGHRDRPNELLLRNPALMNELGVAAARLPGGHVEGFADTFGALFMAIYADVLAGRPAESPRYPTFADGHDEMLVGDAVAESARTGAWVSVVRDGSPLAAAGAPR